MMAATPSMRPLLDLRGQRVLVTGAAGGIGAATCRMFADAGGAIIAADRDEARASVLVAALREEGHDAHAASFDVTDEASVQRAFAELHQRNLEPDILVNNAGLSIRKGLSELSLSEWDAVLGVNLTGAFLCARAAVPAMRSRGRGAIVNIASIMGLSGGVTYPNPAYQASKGGLVNFTRALAVELAPHGIRVNAVAPTWVRTEFIAELTQDPERERRIASLMPLQRIAEPEEVAAAVLFLASAAASMTTGAVLPVDGGFLAQ